MLEMLDKLKSRPDKDKVIINFVSSWFVNGDSAGRPAKETDRCDPRGFYAITKKCAEDLLVSFCSTFGLRYRIFRLSNVYGPGDKGASKQKNALTHMIKMLKVNQPINLYYGGNTIRDFTHVDDICRAMKLLMSIGPTNQITNIGSGIAQNMIELISHAKMTLTSMSAI